MNMNMIVGKKQIILGALVLGLGVAVYLNWQFSQADGLLTSTTKLDEKNYGDAQLVDVPKTSLETDSYFSEAKLSRQKARDEAVASLKEMLSEADLGAEIRAEMTLKATNLAQSIEQESKIENFMKAKGVPDCMVYYDTRRVDVLVKSEGLKAEDVAVIKDLIIKETNVSAENISIVEVNPANPVT